MRETPVASPLTKLPWDKYEELSDPSKDIHGHLDEHLTSIKNSPKPLNSASTTTATEHRDESEYEIKPEDLPYRDHVTLDESEPPDNGDEFTDSDLTELDEDNPLVASDQSSAIDSHINNLQHTNLNNTRDVHKNVEISYCSSRTRHSTRHQLLDDLDAGHTSHLQHALSVHTPNLSPSAVQTHALEQRGTPPGVQPDKAPKRGVSQLSLNGERRISTRLKTATTKRLLMANYFDDDTEDDYHRYPAPRQSSTASGSGLAPVVYPKLETPEQDVQPADSWKTGWEKVDKVPNEPPAAKLPSTSTATSSLKGHSEGHAARKSLRTQRIRRTAKHKKPMTSVKPPRVSCPKNCGMTFGRITDANRHAEQTTGCGSSQKAWTCPSCGNGFSRNDALRRHLGLGDGIKRHQRCLGQRSK